MPWVWKNTGKVATQILALALTSIIAFFSAFALLASIATHRIYAAIFATILVAFVGFFLVGTVIGLWNITRIKRVEVADGGWLTIAAADGEHTYPLDAVDMCYEREVVRGGRPGYKTTWILYNVTMKCPDGVYTIELYEREFSKLADFLKAFGKEVAPCRKAP
ncbi:MAG: hypothetical protein QXU93_08110 [Thermoproteus sp.]